MILLATNALKLIILILEGVPVEQRKAQALIWFHLWWPLTKSLLRLNGTPPEVFEQVEKLVGAIDKND